jgi:hypothetical protein
MFSTANDQREGKSIDISSKEDTIKKSQSNMYVQDYTGESWDCIGDYLL